MKVLRKSYLKKLRIFGYSNTITNLAIPTTMKTLLGRKIMKLLRKSKMIYTKLSSQKPKEMTRTLTNQKKMKKSA